MRRLSFRQVAWFEIVVALTLFAHAAGIDYSDTYVGNGELRDFLSGVAIFGGAALLLSHVVVRRRILRFGLVCATTFSLLFFAIFGGYHQDIVSVILFSTLAVALVMGERMLFDGLGAPRERKSLAPDFTSVVMGMALFIIGTSFAATAIWPKWFGFHIGRLLFGNGAYLITAFAFVFYGAALLVGEMRRKEGIRLTLMRVGAAIPMGALGVSYLVGGERALALPFIAVAVCACLGAFTWRVAIEPSGLKTATMDQKMVHGFANAIRVTVWIFASIAGLLYFDSSVNDFFYFALIAAATTSIFYYHLAPIEKFTKRNYLISHAVLSVAVLAIWYVTGGLESPFIFVSFVVVVAAGVIASPIWVVPFAFAMCTVPVLDAVLEAKAHPRDIEELLVYLLAVFIVSLFTYILGTYQRRFRKELSAAQDSMAASLAHEKDILAQLSVKAKTLASANAELIEMRSALLNVLEDVENSNRQIKIEHHRQETIFAAIGEGLIAADSEGKVILANRMATTLLGMAHDKLMGKPIESVLKFYEEDSTVLDTEIFNRAWTGGPVRMGDRLLLENAMGLRFPVAGTISNFLDDKDRISGIVVAFQDVTVEREVEQQKSSFISVASHQLRTPINAVRWYVDLLLDGDAGRLTKQQREFLGDVSTSVVRMASLIDDLLQVSRAEEGRLQLDFRPVHPKEITAQIAKEIAMEAKKKDQSFELVISKDVPEINTDRKAIAEVLGNLLSNAVKYTPEGGKLGLRIAPAPEGVQFEIWDTGYGIPTKHQHHVFEKFYRGKRAVTLETEGTGLGLYIAKRIIDACKGRIWFESHEGKGSRFFVELPLDAEKRPS